MAALPSINQGVSISALSAYAGQYAPGLITTLFNSLDVMTDLPGDTDVTSERKYPIIDVIDGLEPYSGVVDPVANQIKLSDRSLRVEVGQATLGIDPEIFRRTWAAEMAKITEGRIPLEGYILQQFLRKRLSELNNSTAYFGDTANSGSNKAIKIADGLAKKIAALITAGTITPVTTAAWDEGSGYGVATTAGNVSEGFEAVYMGLPYAYRQNATVTYCSETVFRKYVKDYRRKHGLETLYTGEKKDSLYMDGTGNMNLIRRATWMGNSNRIITCAPGAIRWGTDVAGMASTIDVQKVGFSYVYMMKVVFGIELIDLKAISVGSLT